MANDVSNRLLSAGRSIRRDRYLFLLLLPVLLHYIVFCYFPMYGITLAFKDFQINRGILGSPWVGFKYFEQFFSSIYFWRLIKNTLLLNIYSLVFGFPIPIIFALALNELKASLFKKVVQTVSYFPYFISTVIVVGLISTLLNPVDGIAANIARMLGQEPQNMMSDPRLFRTIYVSSGIWQGFGWSSIIYLAAMAGIDPQLYESAMIDGITRFKRVIYITLPSIKPTIIIILILSFGSMFSIGFEKIILMYNPSVYEVGDVISSYTYRQGIQQSDFSYTTAVGVFNSVINFVILVTANTISRKVSDTSLW